jgi:hypothetical protein
MNIIVKEQLLHGLRHCVGETWSELEFSSRPDLFSAAKEILNLIQVESLHPGTGEYIQVTCQDNDKNIWKLSVSEAAVTVVIQSMNYVQRAYETGVIDESEFYIRLLIDFEEFQELRQIVVGKLRLLTLGTVVVLKGAEKKLMVYGRQQRDSANGQVFDYVAVSYPESGVGSHATFLFNCDAINEVVYFGYINDEETAWLEKLSSQGNQPPAISQDSASV